MSFFRKVFDDRADKKLKIIDTVFGVIVVLCGLLSHILGVQRFLSAQFGMSEGLADTVVLVVALLLLYVEKIITYIYDVRKNRT